MTAGVEEVPQLAVAAPFIVGAILILLLQPLGRFVSRFFEKEVDRIFQVADAKSHGTLGHVTPALLYPASLRQRFEHSADTLASATAIIAPVGSVLALKISGVGDNVSTILILVMGVCFFLVFSLLLLNPGKYATLSFPKGKFALSLVTWVSLVLNVGAAVIAYTLADPVLTQSSP